MNPFGKGEKGTNIEEENAPPKKKKKWETENCMLKLWYTKDIGIINRGEA